MDKFTELNEKVIFWAHEKGILEKATPIAQIDKTIEEVMETRDAIFAQMQGQENYENAKGKLCYTNDEILDGFGDILVTILIGCEMQNISPLDALEAAYNTISKRSGKMINGQFVKDERI